MSINNITDIKIIHQSGRYATNETNEINLSSDEVGLFQQLLQSNQKNINHDGKLLHNGTKEQIAKASDSDELEQELDIVAVLFPPTLDRLAEAQNKFAQEEGTEDHHLKNDSLTKTITNLVNLADINQESKVIVPDGDVVANQDVIISNQQPSMPLTNTGSQYPIIQTAQPDIDNKTFTLETQKTTSLSDIEALMRESESNHPFTSDNVSNLMQKNNMFDANMLASTANNDTAINNTGLLASQANMQNQSLTPTTQVQTTLNLSMPINIAQWQTSLTQQIVMFSRQNIQTAEIKLHPEELGSLHIKLAMDDDKMHLHMMVAHTVVKGVVESAIPHLRTSLEEQGITLQQTDISDFSMMNDSQQSEMFKQPNNDKQQVSLLGTEDEQAADQLLSVEKNYVSAGLSIFA